MELIPLIYLKEGKAVPPAGTHPSWFDLDPSILAQNLVKEGATSLFIHDLNVPKAGQSPNFRSIEAIHKNTSLKLWVIGPFQTLASIDHYAKLGVEKVVLTGAAYQVPNFVRQAVQKYYKLISVKIEVKNNRVVIPGMVAPSPKTAADYAKRFQEEGIQHLCIADSNTQGTLEDQNFHTLKEFCDQTTVPILCLSDVRDREDLAKLFALEESGLMGEVLSKSLYENRIDLHSARAYLDDLAAGMAQRKGTA